MAFGFRDWRPSYNTLDVPLNLGWQCTLAPRWQCGINLWFLRGEERDRVEEDRRVFDRHFRPDLDLRAITGGEALLTIQRFLQTHLNVVHWNQPTDNESIERVLRKAVAEGQLIPTVNRNWRSLPAVFTPPEPPLRWPKPSGYKVVPRAYEYAPERIGNAARGEGTPASSESFDWRSAVETAASAFLDGASPDVGGNGTAMSFVDDATPLGQVNPFEYESTLPGENSLDVAGIPDINGTPNSWIESPPGTKKQWRYFGADGSAAVDIDFDSHHGQPNPHAHNWKGKTRDQGWPVSIFPR